MSFTPAEVDYLTSQPLARFSTTDADGQPDVVPVAFELDGSDIWIGGSGESFLSTRKVRNITAGHRKRRPRHRRHGVVRSVHRAWCSHLRSGERPDRAHRTRRSRLVRADHAHRVLELEHGRRPCRRQMVPDASPSPSQRHQGIGMSDDDPVQTYLDALDAPSREALSILRHHIARRYPDATEHIRYRMPVFKLDGQSFVGFQAAKRHLALHVWSDRTITELDRLLDHRAAEIGTNDRAGA